MKWKGSKAMEKSVWINNKKYTYTQELSVLLKKKITVEGLEAIMRCAERCKICGVEIAAYPTVTWEEAELGERTAKKENGGEKRKPLLNVSMLDLGLTKPSWIA
jgi:hypothetical protein